MRKLIHPLHTVFYMLISCALLLVSLNAAAVIEAHEFANDLERKRYQSFIDELRCPKCQNQNLSGSDAPIAADLRRELFAMIKAGKSDQEIVDFMVSRYGEFVLYRPRVSPVTYVLWIGPVALLILGVIVVMVLLRQRRRLALANVERGLSVDEQARLNLLLTQFPPQQTVATESTGAESTRETRS